MIYCGLDILIWYSKFLQCKIKPSWNFLDSEKFYEFATMIPNLKKLQFDWKLKMFTSVKNCISFIIWEISLQNFIYLKFSNICHMISSLSKVYFNKTFIFTVQIIHINQPVFNTKNTNIYNIICMYIIQF